MRAKYSIWLKRSWPVLLAIALVITISYIGPDAIAAPDQPAPGEYALETVLSGESRILRGPVYFEYAQQEGNSIEPRIFKLHFVNPVTEGGPGFGFLIPFSGTEMIIDTGKYWVDAGNREIMKSYESVFGYADMGGTTTALYFSESGFISLLGCQPGEVSGRIDMTLNDGSGASIQVRGDFKARPLPSNVAL